MGAISGPKVTISIIIAKMERLLACIQDFLKSQPFEGIHYIIRGFSCSYTSVTTGQRSYKKNYPNY
jgi:hypothetical protein